MKKFIYIALMALVSSIAITSCVEENVEPVKEQRNNGNGGGGSDPMPLT